MSFSRLLSWANPTAQLSKTASSPVPVSPAATKTSHYEDPSMRQLKQKIRSAYPDSEVDHLAEFLSSEMKLLEFFQPLLQPVQAAVRETEREAELFEESLQNTMELERAHERVRERFQCAANLKVKLLISALNSPVKRAVAQAVGGHLRFEYGPMHVALIIEDIVLEWGDKSLVIPTSVSPADGTTTGRIPKLKVRVQPYGRLYRSAEANVAELSATLGTRVDYARQKEIFVGIAAVHEKLIRQLVRVIVRYNTGYYYSVRSRNCQRFVKDALKALEIDENFEANLPPEMQEHLTRIRRGKSIQCGHFTSHQGLDDYVVAHQEELGKEEAESLHQLYIRFHAASKSKSVEPGQWQCQEPCCGAQVVSMKIDEPSIRLETYNDR